MKKKLWKSVLKIFVIIILLYSTITFILFCTRGKHFGGYFIQQKDGNQILCYRNNYYTIVNNQDRIEEIYRLGIEENGKWVSTEDYLVTSSKINFPFIEYWLPEIFFYKIIWLQDSTYSGEYLILATLAGSKYYEKY